MKTIPVSLALAGLLLPGLVLADPGEARRPGRLDEARRGVPGAAPMHEGWRVADKDRDGKISRTEFEAMPRIERLPEDKREQLFDRLDKNQDGFISPVERGDGRSGPRGRDSRPIQRLSDLDADRSGGIDFEEFKKGVLFRKLAPERQEEMFRRLDTNGDGQLTPQDQPKPPRRDEGRGWGLRHLLAQEEVERLALEDLAKIGPFAKLSPEELKERFERWDRNRDGLLDARDVPPPAPDRDARPRRLGE
jgi:Ca2+-binding EF-hand superfamily protein